MNEKSKPTTDFTVTITCFPPLGSKVETSQLAILLPPDKLGDLKSWKMIATNIALGFYRLHSGDHRGEELVKEFEKL